MVTQGQKIAYLKKSNSDRQKFAPKLNIKFLQYHELRINSLFEIIGMDKIRHIKTYSAELQILFQDLLALRFKRL